MTARLPRIQFPARWLLLAAGPVVLLLRGFGQGVASEPVASAGRGQDGPARSSLPSGHFPRSAEVLLQDAELVYGPAERVTDLAVLVAQRPDLFGTSPGLAGRVERIALEHSISPRLLLTLLSLAPQPASGGTESYLNQEAAWLADGYYGIKYRGERQIRFADGGSVAADLTAGAAHFAVSRALARHGDAASWHARREAFAARYLELFGPQPWLSAPLPEGLRQPDLLLPWPAGQTWHYTGGPHGAWGVASAWGAVDFAPPSRVGCAAAPEWVLAAAPGLIVHAANGLVLQDLDGDGHPGTGWVLAYLHLAGLDRVRAGLQVQAGDPLGHPSCEGGVADGAHVHVARRHEGEWLPAADGPAPLDLSGWRFQSLGEEYDGAMEHPLEGQRLAVTSRRGGDSAVVSDNGAERRGALALDPVSGEDASPSTADAALTAAATAPSALAALSLQGSRGQPPPPPIGSTHAAAPDPQAAIAPTDSGTGAITRAAPPTLRVRMVAGADSPAARSVTLQVLRQQQVLSSHSLPLDEQGFSAPVALPADSNAVVDLRVNQPGRLPLTAFAIAVAEGLTTVDFTLGGLAMPPVGDVDGDGRIDLADLAAWGDQRRAGKAQADLSGDGDADLGDLWQLLGVLAGR